GNHRHDVGLQRPVCKGTDLLRTWPAVFTSWKRLLDARPRPSRWTRASTRGLAGVCSAASGPLGAGRRVNMFIRHEGAPLAGSRLAQSHPFLPRVSWPSSPPDEL